MPRGPRIDAPGLLHHVRARGVDRRRIFLSDGDLEDFLNRLNRVCEEHGAKVHGWCLMSNHFHLAIRTGNRPLAKTMTSVLTGYAMSFNKVHNRVGICFKIGTNPQLWRKRSTFSL
jgi:REP-associated tyrosine transposase